jgi:hypothetical protein
MGRPRKKTETQNLTFRQVEEYVSSATKRVPGLRKLTILVDDKGKVTFDFEVIEIHRDKGSL